VNIGDAVFLGKVMPCACQPSVLSQADFFEQNNCERLFGLPKGVTTVFKNFCVYVIVFLTCLYTVF
jgi:hypothetical protein